MHSVNVRTRSRMAIVKNFSLMLHVCVDDFRFQQLDQTKSLSTTDRLSVR